MNPRHRTSKIALRVAPGLAAAALLAGACGTETAALSADGAWARTSPMMADNGAAYMVLTADEATTLVSVSVPADVAARAEIHQTVPVGGDMSDDEAEMDDMSDEEAQMGDMSNEGNQMADMAMMMQEVDSIEVPADGPLVLEPGGYHIMLLDLVDPLEVGQTFDVTFTDVDGETFDVTVEVRDEAP